MLVLKSTEAILFSPKCDFALEAFRAEMVGRVWVSLCCFLKMRFQDLNGQVGFSQVMEMSNWLSTIEESVDSLIHSPIVHSNACVNLQTQGS